MILITGEMRGVSTEVTKSAFAFQKEKTLGIYHMSTSMFVLMGQKV